MTNEAGDDIESLVIPPPVRGYNLRDPQVSLDPSYAVSAKNYFSNGATVDMRFGYRYFAKNITAGSIQSLFEYVKADGTRKLIALNSASAAYDVTAGGGIPVFLAANVGTIATAVNFQNRIFIKDYFGQAVKVWDGTTFANAGFVGPGGADALLANPFVYDESLYFIGKDLSVWFTLEPDDVTGTLQQFDMSSFFTMGGSLLWAGPANQVGEIAGKLFVAISNQGEVLVYSGTNPTTSDWGEVSHYYMAAPCGYRSFLNYGSDVLIITLGGVFRLSDVLSGTTPLIPFSDQINDDFVNSFAAQPTGDAVFGQYYPAGQMIIFNHIIPGGSSEQFVYSTRTGGWWHWDNVPIGSMSLFNNALYFGANAIDAIAKFGGDFDEDLTKGGTGAMLTRNTSLVPAYNYLGDDTVNKEYLFITVSEIETQGFSLVVGADVDFQNVAANKSLPDLTVTTSKFYQRPIDITGSNLGKAVSCRLDEAVTQKLRSILSLEIQYRDAGSVGANPI